MRDSQTILPPPWNLLSWRGEGRKITRPMPTPSPNFPLPLPGDASPVTSALEAGNADWGRGDFREAVRWVHRAADAAESAGDDARAVGLARVAADLMAALTPPPAAVGGDEAAALAPFDDFNDQTIVDSPAVLAARATQPSAVIIQERHSTPPPKSRPLPPSSKSAPPPPRPNSARPLTRVGGPQSRTTLRVAVVRDPKSQRTFVANILDEGVPPPAGASEALLVLLDPATKLLENN